MAVPAPRSGVYCDTIKDVLAPLENQSMPWGESVDRVLSSFSLESGPRFCSCWLKTTQLGQLLIFPMVKHPSLTEGTDSTSRLLNACTQSADLSLFSFPLQEKCEQVWCLCFLQLALELNESNPAICTKQTDFV